MLVGRQSEQRTIDALVSAARIGQSSVLVITGEAGIGKTALLSHALAAAAGMHVLRVTGSESEQNLPFAGLTQLLRPDPADLDSLPPPQAQALGVALALRDGAGVDRFAVGAAALTLLTQQSEHQPLAVLVDDAHLVDLPSQETLAFVARRLLADAVVVLATVRSGEPCALVTPDLPSLELRGLGAAATRELLSDRLHRPAGTELSERVHGLSGGNPLAILELSTDLSGLLTLWPGAPGPVPAALVQLYERRAAELGAAAREALLLAAAAGDDLPLVARACAARGISVDAITEAERVGLVRIAHDRVEFTHPLARSAIYSTATAPERRRLHATLAAATTPGDEDRRAWHRAEATLGTDPATAVELRDCGARAAARGAFAVAATAFERAARLSPEAADRAERLVQAAAAAWRAGDGSRARRLLDEALGQHPVGAVGARAQRLLGIIALRSGSLPEALTALVTAARDTGLTDPAEALACWAEAIDACYYLADADGAMSAADEVERLLAAGGTGRPAMVATVAAGMARVLAGVAGGPDLIRRGVVGLTTVGPRAELSEEASWSLLGPLFLRESDAGRDLVRRAIDERRDRAAVGSLPHLLFHIARDEATSDQWTQAEASYGEAVALAEEFGQTTEQAASAAGLAWLLARQGRSAETRRLAADAERLGLAHQIHFVRLWVRYALGDLAFGLGQVGEAIAGYRELEALLTDLRVRDVDLSPVPELVECLVGTGRAGEATELADRYREQAEAKGQPWALARAARLSGLLCGDDEVDDRFRSALELHAATLDRFELARSQLAHGTRLRRLRRRVDARPPLRSALAEFTRLGAVPWAGRAADELAATGVTALRPGAQPASQLTPRELQIALLLAGGRTIREAAAALFLSPKTVEYHLRHVYTKLGIDSRSQLAEQVLGLAASDPA